MICIKLVITVAYCGPLILVNIGSVYDLFLDNSKPWLDPLLMYDQLDSRAYSRTYFSDISLEIQTLPYNKMDFKI